MELEFSYSMLCEFSNPIKEHHFALKCLPLDTNRQHIIELQLNIEPHLKYNTQSDSFGNQIMYGSIPYLHDRFYVVLSGRAETGLDVCEYHQADDYMLDLYRAPSRYTKPGAELKRFFQKVYVSGLSDYEMSLRFMDTLYEYFSYETGATTIKTTAEEALRKRRGICQDYAHILTAALRMAKIPSRYVVGMMLGEGASHAWVEVYCKGYWYGLDPTHNKLVDENYIKISHGRDYGDCIVSRGVFHNFTQQTQQINVIVKNSNQ